MRRVWMALLVLACPLLAGAQYVTLTGKLQGANGVPLSSGSLSFQPTQWFYIAGTGVVVNSTVSCATTSTGQVVGIGDPQAAPAATSAAFGSLPGGTYSVRFAWRDAAGNVTGPSPSQQLSVPGSGTIVIQPPTSGVPQTAVGMNVYIGTQVGGEYLQALTQGTNSYVQSAPLATQTLYGANSTQCRLVANDAGWPTNSGYSTTLADSAGNVLPGYPMNWRVIGAGTTVDLSQGVPMYDGLVNFPSPILASPPNNATQSISGGLVIFGNQPVLTAQTAQISRGTPGALSEPWGYSPGWTYGGSLVGAYVGYSVPPASGSQLQSLIHLQTRYNYTSDLPLDFPGAAGASMPAGVYSEVETSGGSNIQPHAVDGYCINGGSQDCIGVSGRIRRKAGATSTTSGMAEGAGVYGSAYQENSASNGAVMGGEFSIFQNVPGTGPLDYLPFGVPGWAVALHVNSLSTGARANALIEGDASGGLFGAWNFEICDNSIWSGAGGAPANGLLGTVCWNGGDWDGSKYPDVGMKMGNVHSAHLWCNYGDCVFLSNTGAFDFFGGNHDNPTTGSGMNFFPGPHMPAFLTFWNAAKQKVGDIYTNDQTNTMTINDTGTDTYANPQGGFLHIDGNTVFPLTDNSDKAANTAWVTGKIAQSSTAVQQLVITSGICTASGGSYSTCTMNQQNWGTAYADANYAVSCQGVNPSNGGNGSSLSGQIFNVAKSAQGVTISLESNTSSGFTYGEIDCLAHHN